MTVGLLIAPKTMKTRDLAGAFRAYSSLRSFLGRSGTSLLWEARNGCKHEGIRRISGSGRREGPIGMGFDDEDDEDEPRQDHRLSPEDFAMQRLEHVFSLQERKGLFLFRGLTAQPRNNSTTSASTPSATSSTLPSSSSSSEKNEKKFLSPLEEADQLAMNNNKWSPAKFIAWLELRAKCQPKPSRSVIEHFESLIPSFLYLFTETEIVKLLEVMNQLGRFKMNGEIYRSIETQASRLAENMSGSLVATSLLTFSHYSSKSTLYIPKQATLQVFFQRLMEQIESLGASDLNNTLRAFSTLGTLPDTAIPIIVHRLIQILPTFPAKDIEGVLGSFFKLQPVYDPPTSVLDLIAAHTFSILRSCNHIDLANILFFLSQFSQFQPSREFLVAFESAAQRKIPRFSETEWSRLVLAFSRFQPIYQTTIFIGPYPSQSSQL